MKSQSTRSAWLFRVLIVMALLITLAAPLSSSFAQGTPNQPDDGDDQFVSPGERFVTPQELSRIERDYREYGEDEQGQDECGQYWVVLNREYLGMVVINSDVLRDELLAVNTWIDRPNLVYPGEAILIPQGDFDEILDPFTDRPYTGETLSTDL